MFHGKEEDRCGKQHEHDTRRRVRVRKLERRFIGGVTRSWLLA